MTSILSTSRRPDISFYPNGRIDITARIAKMLALQAGDVIDVAEEGGEYYLYVRLRAERCTGRYEAQAYPTSRQGLRRNNMRAYSRQLVRAVMRIARHPRDTDQPLRLPAGQPVTIKSYGNAVPLITHNPL